MTTSQKYQERLESLAKFHDGTDCLVCHRPLTDHIGVLPCIKSEAHAEALRSLYSLPVFEWAWNGLKVGR